MSRRSPGRCRPAPQFEELERRLLYSADLAPFAVEPGAQPQVAFELPAQQALAQQALRHEIVFVGWPGRRRRGDRGIAARSAGGRAFAGGDPPGSHVGRAGADHDSADRRSDIAAVHIISHGTDGALELGDTLVDSASLASRAREVSAWGAALGEDADLLLYGCDVARGSAGAQFVAQLAALTGADVAASNDLTGNAADGGDWKLEISTGAIETALAPSAHLQAAWHGVLNTYTVSKNTDSGAGSLRRPSSTPTPTRAPTRSSSTSPSTRRRSA
jgi:hypothetical protein